MTDSSSVHVLLLDLATSGKAILRSTSGETRRVKWSRVTRSSFRLIDPATSEDPRPDVQTFTLQTVFLTSDLSALMFHVRVRSVVCVTVP